MQKPLLPGDESGSSEAVVVSGSSQRWRHVARGVATLLLTLSLAAIAAYRLHWRTEFASPDKALSFYYGQLEETEATGNDAQWLQCVRDTGGTCFIWGCHADRGPTDCKWFAGAKRCLCQEGQCSGLDGKCQEQPNEVVAASVRFRNAQWPDYYLYMTSWSIGVTNTPDDTTKFNLLEVPTRGPSDKPLERKRFLLGSVSEPSYVVRVSRHQECEQCSDGTDAHGNTQYRDCRCRDVYEGSEEKLETLSIDKTIQLQPAYWNEPAVMIQSANAYERFLYVPHGSWNIAASEYGDPGPQGYWIPDQDIPGLED